MIVLAAKGTWTIRVDDLWRDWIIEILNAYGVREVPLHKGDGARIDFSDKRPKP